MVPQSAVRICFEISTLYTIFLAVLFLVKRDTAIPLTFRTTVYKWGALQDLMRKSPTVLNQGSLDEVLSGWCPEPSGGANLVARTPVSPQCSCIRDFRAKFENNSATYLRGGGPKDLAALGDLQAQGVLDACLRKRTTWRRETCKHFCQVPLLAPILVSSLCMSLFFSRIVNYSSQAIAMIAMFLPILLALLVLTVNFIWDVVGAIPVVLTVFSMLMEIALAHHCIEDAKAYWSFQRFFMGSIAVWAAVSHQGRDLYVVSAYAVLGFFAGMLAYAQYIIRHKQCCNQRLRVVAIYAWVGVCVISACFLLLVQQHWYPDSPMWSSSVSVVCLAFTCLQCIGMAPGMFIPSVVQLMIGLMLLSIGVVAVAVDVLVVLQ